jgi:hypothetical protein
MLPIYLFHITFHGCDNYIVILKKNVIFLEYMPRYLRVKCLDNNNILLNPSEKNTCLYLEKKCIWQYVGNW